MYGPTMLGGISWGAALLLFLLQMLTILMEKELKIFTIEELFGLKYIEQIPWGQVQKAAVFLSKTELYYILAVVGLIFIVIGMLRR